eukprot:scaffold5098_cov130-Skeletonema_menzelii.AAC.2
MNNCRLVLLLRTNKPSIPPLPLFLSMLACATSRCIRMSWKKVGRASVRSVRFRAFAAIDPFNGAPFSSLFCFCSSPVPATILILVRVMP